MTTKNGTGRFKGVLDAARAREDAADLEAVPVNVVLEPEQESESAAQTPAKAERKTSAKRGRPRIYPSTLSPREPRTAGGKAVRDNYTLLPEELALLEELRHKAARAGAMLTKSEILRLGLYVIQNLNETEMVDAIAELPRLRRGRPET